MKMIQQNGKDMNGKMIVVDTISAMALPTPATDLAF
jgi:hypothetical protein